MGRAGEETVNYSNPRLLFNLAKCPLELYIDLSDFVLMGVFDVLMLQIC